MDAAIKAALDRGGIVDISTVGAQTGRNRRIEIYLHQFDGRYYITGRPGRRRDWLANLIANPHFTVHLKRGLQADVPAVAAEITDPAERERVIYRARTESWNASPDDARRDMDFWVKTSPLVVLEPTGLGDAHRPEADFQ
ncbi:MAG TPA: nitroreductase/quinone reductase family protein [Acidimicrobiia bacterium]|nr:nitroreductase/quinone reductase family protein [Acidimicrobiia bacterium]